MLILLTVHYTFSVVLTKETLYNNRELLWLVMISIFLVTLMCEAGVIFRGGLDASQSLQSKGHVHLWKRFANMIVQYLSVETEKQKNDRLREFKSVIKDKNRL